MNSKKKIREFVLLEKSTPRKNRNPSIYDLELLDRQGTVGTCMIDV